jgi:hypothetical protein
MIWVDKDVYLVVSLPDNGTRRTVADQQTVK